MKIKTIIITFVITCMLLGSVTAFAAGVVIKDNPFPILVNGIQQAIKAYNIDGYTYLKISDVSKTLGNGVTVKFDEVKEQIQIETVTQAVYSQPVSNQQKIKIYKEYSEHFQDMKPILNKMGHSLDYIYYLNDNSKQQIVKDSIQPLFTYGNNKSKTVTDKEELEVLNHYNDAVESLIDSMICLNNYYKTRSDVDENLYYDNISKATRSMLDGKKLSDLLFEKYCK